MKKNNQKPLYLAGDIGGTKTVIGLFQSGEKRPIAIKKPVYPSQEAKGLEEIVENFLTENPVKIQGACFGIAGPVIDGKVHTTNIPWVVSERRLKRRFGWPSVRVINDLAATAIAVPLLRSDELVALNSVRRRKDASIALVAPGTGLGQALLIFDKGRYIPVATEGGHVDFAPNNEGDPRLWQYLHRRWGHVSVERVISGPGLVNIYDWLRHEAGDGDTDPMADQFKMMDPARAITEAALNHKNPLCAAALEKFVEVLGAVAGNLALTGLTLGGVYLGGGIPPKILPALTDGRFMDAFQNKGRFGRLLAKLPVRVILNPRAALLGAAHCALRGSD
jgi:glucokinase